MKLRPRLKSDISKVKVITIAYVLISWYFVFYIDSLLLSDYSLGPSKLYNLGIGIGVNSLTGILAGTLGGWVLVFVNNKFFRRKSYMYAMCATFLAYSLVFIVVTVFASILTARINLGSEVGFQSIADEAGGFVFSKLAFSFYVFWGAIAILTLLFLQINDKFGPGMFRKFLMGQYNQPQEEQRIFMFLDMKSSTTIAEKIGNKMYFNLLNDLFSDMTNPILSNEGEIYQYVGDEVVVSWSLEKGINNANCLNCFTKIRERLIELSSYYQDKYGITPEFKAGLHHGLVMAGEIGSIKKDIVYSGDVLNTTSRIQEQCNHYQVDFLVSQQTLELMEESIPYEAVPLGDIELRGKKMKIGLNTIKAVNSTSGG